MNADVDADLRRQAREYAASLVDGDTIEPFDVEVVRPFARFLPAALARRGFYIEYESTGRWRVCAPRCAVCFDLLRECVCHLISDPPRRTS